MADYDYQWDSGSSDYRRVAELNEDAAVALSAQIAALTYQVQSINEQRQVSRRSIGDQSRDWQMSNTEAYQQTTNFSTPYHQEQWMQEQSPYAYHPQYQDSHIPDDQQNQYYCPVPGFQEKQSVDDRLTQFIEACGDRFRLNEERGDRIEERLDKLESNISEISSALNSLSEQIDNLAYAIKEKEKVVYTPKKEEFPNDCRAVHSESGRQQREPNIEPQRDTEEDINKSFIVVPAEIICVNHPPKVAPQEPILQWDSKKKIDMSYEEMCKWMDLKENEYDEAYKGLEMDDDGSEVSTSTEEGEADGAAKEVNREVAEHKGGQQNHEEVHISVDPPRKRKRRSKDYGPVTIHRISPSGAIQLITKEGRIYRAKRHRFKSKEEAYQSTDSEDGMSSLRIEKRSRKSS